MDRFLVTGGAGFVGSNFIHYLLRKYPDIKITNLDKLTYAGNLDNLKDIESESRYKFIQGDIKDRKLVKELMKGTDIVVHFAAETHVDRSILEAGEFILTDVYGTYILLDEARIANIKLFIHISTDEVYGSIDNGSFKEEDNLAPSSPYSASKVGGDRLAYSYTKTYDLPVIILRPSNNYGPYQYPEKVIPLFITNALEDKPLPIYGDGKNVRDWLFVEDCCEAVDLMIRKGTAGEVYNLGASQEVPNIEMAQRILDILNKPDSLIKFVKDRLGHDRRYSLYWDKLKKLGWQPKFDVKAGLEKTVKWYKENQHWWRKIKQKSEEFKKFYQAYYQSR